MVTINGVPYTHGMVVPYVGSTVANTSGLQISSPALCQHSVYGGPSLNLEIASFGYGAANTGVTLTPTG